MQGCFLAIVGLVFGAVFGAALGVGIGLAYTKLFHVSDFEGYSGMLVFYTFLPIGAIAGGLGRNKKVSPGYERPLLRHCAH